MNELYIVWRGEWPHRNLVGVFTAEEADAYIAAHSALSNVAAYYHGDLHKTGPYTLNVPDARDAQLPRT